MESQETPSEASSSTIAETGTSPHESRMELRAVHSQFQGPVPPPELLQQYEKICPGSADRLIRMAELQSEHRRDMESRMLAAQINDAGQQRRETRLGQILGFSSCVLAIAAAVWLAFLDARVAASIIGGGVILGLAGAFVYIQHAGTSEKREESRSRIFPEGSNPPEVQDSQS